MRDGANIKCAASVCARRMVNKKSLLPSPCRLRQLKAQQHAITTKFLSLTRLIRLCVQHFRRTGPRMAVGARWKEKNIQKRDANFHVTRIGQWGSGGGWGDRRRLREGEEEAPG